MRTPAGAGAVDKDEDQERVLEGQSGGAHELGGIVSPVVVAFKSRVPAERLAPARLNEITPDRWTPGLMR
jgi:hypothetical protein